MESYPVTTDNTTADVVTLATKYLSHITEWRGRTQHAVNEVADDILQHPISTVEEYSILREHLDKLLIKKLTISDDTSECGEYVDSESYHDNGRIPPQQIWPQSPSRQMSLSSSVTSRDGHTIHIRRTHSGSYPCFRDAGNGVMALHENELVFVDQFLQKSGPGELKMRIVSIGSSIPEENEDETETEGKGQCPIRIVSFPPETKNMRVVDLEYVEWNHAYIVGLNPYTYMHEDSLNLRPSWLYWFDSIAEEFEQWIPLSDCQGNRGLITRLSCCANKSIIYVTTNNFGQQNILVFNEWGTITDTKTASDLFPEVQNVRFADVACTRDNTVVAVAYNSATKESEGLFGVRIWDPTTWIRISSLDLGQTLTPYVVPRLVWLHQLDMFALVNHINGQLCVFDRQANRLGQRSFVHFVPEYQPPEVFPINVCAAERHWVALRYTRFITIHRVNE